MSVPSYEVRLDRVHALLVEWGECQRREPYPGVQGYPSMSVEGRMIEDYGYRTDKSRRWAWTGKGRAQRQTRVHVAKRGDEWPEHIQRLDRIVARLDRRAIAALVAVYSHGRSLRETAARLHIGKTKAARYIEQARWFLAGALTEVDQVDVRTEIC